MPARLALARYSEWSTAGHPLPKKGPDNSRVVTAVATASGLAKTMSVRCCQKKASVGVNLRHWQFPKQVRV
jgi:hypothetical protein